MSERTDDPDGPDAEPAAPEPAAPEPAAPESAAPEPTTSEPVPPPPAEPEALAPDAPATEPVPPPPVPPGPTDPPLPAWVAPASGKSGGGRRRGCLIAVIVLGAVLVLGYLGLVFLGNQALSILGGTIQFGTGGSGCSVTGTGTSFPTSASIRSVAFLKEDLPAGTPITFVVTYADGTTESTDESFETTARCVTQEIDPGLPPGHYGLEYRLGTEVAAKGAFDITP